MKQLILAIIMTLPLLLVGCTQSMFYSTTPVTITVQLNGNMTLSSVQNVVKTIESAKASDKVIIEVNSTGGDVFALYTLLNAINESKATVVYVLESHGMSAAAMTMCYVDAIKQTDHSIVMFHAPFYTDHTGVLTLIEKNKEFFTAGQQKMYEEFVNMFKVCVKQGILTPQEADDIMKKGTEVWLSAEELNKRLAGT